MTTTDSIILVREAKTCSYVLVIHTPRLCGEPGFKSRIDSRDESYIRCREIVESIEPATDTDSNPLTASDRPLKMSQRQPLLTVPSRPPADSSTGDGSGKANLAANDRLRKMLEVVLGSKDKIVVEQVDIGGVGDLEDLLFEFELGDLAVMDGDLEDAGIEVKGEKTDNKKEKKKKEEKKGDEDQPQMRDEL
jgi:protein OS-9